MYIKVAGRTRDRSKLVEVQEFEHRIVRIENRKVDLKDIGLEHMSLVEFYGDWDWDASENEKGVRAVILTFPDGAGGERAIVVHGCAIYVMGEDGQTVDTIRY
jgi:hypothetical protein